MDISTLGAIGELIGGIAVLATIAYLAIQVRKAQAAAEANAYIGAQNLAFVQEQQLIEYAELWVKSERGEPLTDAEELILERIIEARNNAAFYAYARTKALGQEISDVVCENFARFLLDNPKAHDRWVTRMNKIDKYRSIGEFDAKELGKRSLGKGFSDSVKSFVERMDSK